MNKPLRKLNTRIRKEMKVIYLAHPYGGDEQNVEDAKRIVKELVKIHHDKVFLSPLQATGFYYNDIPYIEGMHHCLELLSRCDEIWFCKGWEDSKGCMMEYAFAKAKGIPIHLLV